MDMKLKNPLHRRVARLVSCVVALASVIALGAPAARAACDPDALQASGATYRICMPEGDWNGDLVIYAHGYVAFNEPLGIPEDQLELDSGVSIPLLVNTLGYAFATTGYSVNGLAVPEGVADIVDLLAIFKARYGQPRHVLLAGVSEGALIVTQALERYPQLFSGAMAGCGPVGDFRRQINSFGDFRVVFDVFFPGVMPGSLNDVPPWLITYFEWYYANVVRPTVLHPANAQRLSQLFLVTGAALDLNDVAYSVDKSIRDALWYNTFGVGDAIAKLGGQPYANSTRYYLGSLNDAALNASVQRYQADPAALAAIDAKYSTTGNLQRPLINLHTTQDPQVPYWHATLYGKKVQAAGASANYLHVRIPRYGHCNFTAAEVLASFALMNLAVQAREPEGIAELLPPGESAAQYESIMKQYRATAKRSARARGK